MSDHFLSMITKFVVNENSVATGVCTSTRATKARSKLLMRYGILVFLLTTCSYSYSTVLG